MRIFHILLPFVIFSCARPKEASVSRITQSVETKLPMTLRSLTGSRDGYFASGEMSFMDTTGGSSELLILRFKLEPGVPTRFVGGDYTWGPLTGNVTCQTVDFFGGQGGAPSIGGIFTFTGPDGDSYKVSLPTTEMKMKR